MRRGWIVLLLVALVAAGCAADPQDPGQRAAPGAADINVDTPQLRKMKQQAGVAPCEPGDAQPVDGGLPDVTLPCLGGGRDVDLSRLRGPMVINLWQSTCGPCRTEMPILQRFHEQYGDRVAVLGIDYQDVQVEAAMELVRDTGVTYPLLADPQSRLDGADPIPRLIGMPFLALVDADGRVVHQEFGGIESEQELIDLVDQHLAVRL